MNPNNIEKPQNNNNSKQDNAWQKMASEVMAEQQEKPTYKKIENVSDYVKELTNAGAETITAEKFARIAARQGRVGEKVTSWSVDSEGNPIVEKEAEVVVDEESGAAGWIATKMDENGEPIVDQNGHTNEWIIDDKTFHKKYEDDPEHPGVFKPKGGPQKFMRTPEAITINQRGDDKNVDTGGYINVTNPDDMYVISERDFTDTYKEKANN